MLFLLCVLYLHPFSFLLFIFFFFFFFSNVKEDQLRELFGKFGDIQSCRCNEGDNPFAFIAFKHVPSAKQAQEGKTRTIVFCFFFVDS